MKAETAKKRKTEALQKRLSELDEKYRELTMRDHGINHGYGMRAYSRLKHLSFAKDDACKESARVIAEELRSRNIPVHTHYVKV